MEAEAKALKRMPAVMAGSALAAVMLLAALLGPVADAGAAGEQSRAGKAKKQRNAKKGNRNVKRPFAKNGPVYACVRVQGRGRGIVRVVRHPRVCRRLSGWHRFAWDRIGAAGPPGSGLPGAAGAGGDDGSHGAQGADGQDAQIAQLLERIIGLENEVGILESLLGGVDVVDLQGTVGDLTGELGILDGTVGELGGDLVDLEGTVQTACAQLSTLTGLLDETVVAIADISLNEALDLLGGLVQIPSLPVINEFECV